MGQNAQTERPQRGAITIDWMVMAVACIALLFLLGTMLRTSVDGDALRSSDFRSLQGDETLLAFQDFSFDATGWDPADTSGAVPGQGPVLGPFTTQAIQRSFAMPSDATAVQMTFDLHLIGPWNYNSAFHVSLGAEEVLTVTAPDEDGALSLSASEADTLRVFAQTTAISPRPAQTELPGANDDFVTLRIGIELAAPPETVTLRLLGESTEAEGDARWTLDNLTVVATAGDRS